ncbi:hypothetical protein [Streptomyces narbonensis]|uniref:hypothetical protein n=1 Tax=Streptomyces narbonensis TaxID=67333 RepID=UPI0016783768|nr:hypothetical protein [Streptomyces narbonensis]GGV97305.1 hypothetical protein GCM10010230_17320 [Streptomyces narbonensis]
MKSSTLRRTLATAVALGALGTGSLVTAAPASAAMKDGRADFGEFILHYSAGLDESWTDFAWDEDYLFNDRFITPGSGYNQAVDNNAESYLNRADFTWYVYTGAVHTGNEGWLPDYYLGDFSSNFKNQVSSIYNNDAN